MMTVRRNEDGTWRMTLYPLVIGAVLLLGLVLVYHPTP